MPTRRWAGQALARSSSLHDRQASRLARPDAPGMRRAAFPERARPASWGFPCAHLPPVCWCSKSMAQDDCCWRPTNRLRHQGQPQARPSRAISQSCFCVALPSHDCARQDLSAGNHQMSADVKRPARGGGPAGQFHAAREEVRRSCLGSGRRLIRRPL
jgi:hypothetical protein